MSPAADPMALDAVANELSNPESTTTTSTAAKITTNNNHTYTLHHHATLTPAASTRTWQTVPHPTMPIAVTACSDRTARVYSLKNFTLLDVVGGGHRRSVRACAWKPDTRPHEAVLATGSFDASAGIWRKWYNKDEDSGGGGKSFGDEDDDESGDGEDDDEFVFTVLLDGHDSEIKSVAFATSAPLLATASRDKSVWVWEEMEGGGEDDSYETIAVLQAHDADVKCVAWHPDESLLASASYDDSVRLHREDPGDADWVTVAALLGHEGTVWWVEFEPKTNASNLTSSPTSSTRETYLNNLTTAGPRLATASDDLTIRIWQKHSPATDIPDATTAQRMPSIIRSYSMDEDWIEHARLPPAHDRAIYALSWSKRSGLIVSGGGDGRIVVYRERWRESTSPLPREDIEKKEEEEARVETEWVVVAEVEAAHGVYEVNHVCWAKRWDKRKKKGGEGQNVGDEEEEVIISTGDDGEVRVWTLEFE